MLYQMLSGVLPFRGDSMSELMFKIANEEAADIRSVCPELPEALAHVVALALSKRPETRYQSGDLFAADLRAVAAQGLGVSGAQAVPVDAQGGSGLEKTVAFATTVAAASAGPGHVVGGTDIEIYRFE
jgi:serine/threonine-protein kinase